MGVESPEGNEDGEKFEAGKNRFAELGDPAEGDSPEKPDKTSTLESRLEQAGLGEVVSPQDIQGMQEMAKAMADAGQAELMEMTRSDPDYNAERARITVYHNIASGEPMLANESNERSKAEMQRVVDGEQPYVKLAARKEEELRMSRGDEPSPQKALDRAIASAGVPSPDMAQAEIDVLRIALEAEKIKAIGRANESAPADNHYIELYSGMITSLEGYKQGDRSIEVPSGSGTMTAESYMQGHIVENKREVAEALRARRAEGSAQAESGSGTTDMPQDQPGAESTERPETADPVPTDPAGMREYERDHFEKFDPGEIPSMRAFVSASIDRLDELHASANNPNIRYPDSVAQVMGSSLSEANVFLANLVNYKNSFSGGQRVENADQILGMPFSDFARDYLDMDVEATNPNYFKVFRDRR